MLSSLLDGLKDQIPTDLLNQVGLDASKAGDVAEIAGESAKEVMSSQLASGAMDTVMNLFSKGENNTSANSLQETLTNNFVGKLVEKLGLDQNGAGAIATALIPKIIAIVTNKNEETDASDTSSLLSMFGGKDGAIDAAKGMLGGLFS